MLVWTGLEWLCLAICVPNVSHFLKGIKWQRLKSGAAEMDGYRTGYGFAEEVLPTPARRLAGSRMQRRLQGVPNRISRVAGELSAGKQCGIH